jgi:hypothetical protein
MVDADGKAVSEPQVFTKDQIVKEAQSNFWRTTDPAGYAKAQEAQAERRALKQDALEARATERAQNFTDNVALAHIKGGIQSSLEDKRIGGRIELQDNGGAGNGLNSRLQREKNDEKNTLQHIKEAADVYSLPDLMGKPVVNVDIKSAYTRAVRNLGPDQASEIAGALRQQAESKAKKDSGDIDEDLFKKEYTQLWKDAAAKIPAKPKATPDRPGAEYAVTPAVQAQRDAAAGQQIIANEHVSPGAAQAYVAELDAAIAKAKGDAKSILISEKNKLVAGLSSQGAAQKPAPTTGAPPAALSYLKSNPSAAGQFKQKYGYLPEGY